MAYRDGFYVNGLPLAKAYRELPESVRGRGGGAFANCYPKVRVRVTVTVTVRV